MSWWFSSAPEVCAYGKLPLSKEFLRVRCFEDEALAFRLWLDQGHASASSAAGDDSFRIGRTFHSLLLWKDSSMAIVARVRDSSDSGGHRKFPFSLFAAVPVRKLAASLTERIDQIAPLLKSLQECEARAADLADAASFLEMLHRFELPSFGRPAEDERFDALMGSPLEKYVKGLMGEDDPSGRLANRLYELRSACATIRTTQKAGRPAPWLRVALVAGIAADVQARVWTALIDRNRWLPSETSCVVLSADDDERPVLMLTPRTTDKDDLRHWSDRGESMLVPPTSSSAANRPGYLAFVSSVERMLSDSRATVARLGQLDLPE